MNKSPFREKSINTNDPYHLYFNLNYNCNSNCIFCASNHEILSGSNNLSINDLRRIFEKYPPQKGDNVLFTGGEPTLLKDLPLMVNEAHEFGATVMLFTNGRLLKNIALTNKICNSGVSLFSIPIYGTSSEDHDNTTRSGVSKKVTR